MPPDEEEEDEEEAVNEPTNFLRLWSMAVRSGVPDDQWQNLTIPKLRALGKAKRDEEEFQVRLHGGEVDKKPKKAKLLSDLGFFK